MGFGHDVRAGGLAEILTLPDLRPDSVTVFVPIGTGLAAAIVGRAVLTGHGWAGEIGQLVFPWGPHAGKRIEQVASASAVARRVGVPGAAEAVAMVAAGDPAPSGSGMTHSQRWGSPLLRSSPRSRRR